MREGRRDTRRVGHTRNGEGNGEGSGNFPTVCFLTGTLNAFAGAERMTAVIANELAHRGFKVRILSLWDKTSCFPLHAEVRHDALFAERPSFKRKYVETVAAIRRYVRQHRVDVLVEVDTMLTLFTLPACLGLGVRRIAWEHCNFDQDLGKPARRLARRLAARTCERVVVLTASDRLKWQRALDCLNVDAIPNALPFDLPVRPSSRESKTVLAIGRLTEAKGFDLLLDAWAEVNASQPEWRLDIIGDGDLRHGLLAQCDRLHLGDSVRILPARADVQPHYAEASVFCMSSRYEGFGLVLIEAMAYGLAIVSTDCETGPRELLRDRENALVTVSGDARALASGLLTVLSDCKLAEAISTRARIESAKFSSHAIGDHWQRLIRADD